MGVLTDPRAIRHPSSSRRFKCSCGVVHEYWGEVKGTKKPNHFITCTCGIKHWRG